MDIQRFLRRLFKINKDNCLKKEKDGDSTQKHVKSELVGAVWTVIHNAYSAACGNLFLA